MEKDKRIHISVIIPTYNSEKYIHKCLDSLLEQTYHDFEVVVIDDYSKDSTLSILEKYNKTYPDKIIFSQNSENMGASFSKNEAVKLAHYDYIACIDSDAIAPADWLEKGAKFFEQSELFTGRFESIPLNRFEEAVYIMTNFPDTDRVYNKYDDNFAVAGTNIFFTRGVFLDAGGFNPEMRACEDTLFLRQAIKRGNNLNYHHDLYVFHSCKQNLRSYTRYFNVIQKWCRSTNKVCPFKRYRHFSLVSLLFLLYIVLGISSGKYIIFGLFSIAVLVSFYIFQVNKFKINKKYDFNTTNIVFLIAGFLKLINLYYILKIYLLRQKPEKYWRNY
ncbi:MAG: glycosyltransferase family 2 protein [Nitrospirae bacterium]|nr:glycosyltransferase family 2 protein [Nitrospirota bacterium]MBF0540180.1 glycosyltransferase family 2 protein [Nitrospirota bacterium]